MTYERHRIADFWSQSRACASGIGRRTRCSLILEDPALNTQLIPPHPPFSGQSWLRRTNNTIVALLCTLKAQFLGRGVPYTALIEYFLLAVSGNWATKKCLHEASESTSSVTMQTWPSRCGYNNMNELGIASWRTQTSFLSLPWEQLATCLFKLRRPRLWVDWPFVPHRWHEM